MDYPNCKRLFDVTGAALLGLLAAPVLLVAGCLSWLECGSPVFFRQTRAGRSGSPFTIFKLRTLHTAPHDPNRPVQQETRVGRVLRRWGLDELPQLWNVLRGDMSLIGPRPTLPEQVERYGPWERRRLAVRPGLTGWAQIHGRNRLSWPERIALDVWYVEHLSFGLDLRILLRTPATLVCGQGVYGTGGINPGFPERHPEITEA